MAPNKDGTPVLKNIQQKLSDKKQTSTKFDDRVLT